MRTLCSVPVSMQHFNGTVQVLEWCRNDPFPALGPSVGVDTETELITDERPVPPLVVLGVFDPASSTCYISYWEDAPEFMRQLCERDIEQRYFNLGFDEQVLDNEDPETPLLDAIEQGRVVDMQIRIHLHEIATVGFIRHNLHNLAGCTLHFERHQLDKGDGTENSARLSFRRGVPITDEQARYLPFDCISTWCLGEAVGPQATEDIHTKGMVVLAHTSTNGMLVDRTVFKALTGKLLDDKEKFRKELVLQGFPDPDRDEQKEAADQLSLLYSNYFQFIEQGDIESRLRGRDDLGSPSRTNLRLVIMYLWNHEGEPGEVDLCIDNVHKVFEQERGTLRKHEKEFWDRLCETYGLLSLDTCKRDVAWNAYVAALLGDYCRQVDSGNANLRGFDFVHAVEAADAVLDAHPSWLKRTDTIGPKKFFQQHVTALLERNPELQLDRTEKSGDIKLTLKDMWRLSDLKITDKFLESYTGYKHCEKMLSTYLDPKWIKPDGRVRSRFTNVLRTGRTSSSSPNVQNLPSRDAVYPIKNIYTAPEGYVMCATDFSFAELVAFAESCIQRFGFSVMGDIINAGIDPHRWFAGVRKGIIDASTDFTRDPKACLEMEQYLEAQITKPERQAAKGGNFGLPGGMSAYRLWINLREQGIYITFEEATELRETWIRTFREMKYHMQPEEMSVGSRAMRQYGQEEDQDDDDEVQDDGDNRRLYRAKTILGMLRSRCSFCSALNLHFQAVVACGAKIAGWNLLYYAGMGDRISNFVHDEYIYLLRPEELVVKVPQVEACMLAGMRAVCPHVKVSVETSIMRHWDKGAAVLSIMDGKPCTLDKKTHSFVPLDSDGLGGYIIAEPDFVRQAYGQLPVNPAPVSA